MLREKALFKDTNTLFKVKNVLPNDRFAFSYHINALLKDIKLYYQRTKNALSKDQFSLSKDRNSLSKERSVLKGHKYIILGQKCII